MVALGAELARRGHDVVVGLSRGGEELGRRAGLSVLPVGPDPYVWLQTDDVLALVARGKALAVANGLMAGLHPYASEIDDEVLAACQGADVVVSGFLAEGRGFCGPTPAPPSSQSTSGPRWSWSTPSRHGGPMPYPSRQSRHRASPVSTT
jgi:hypothetical protein